MSEFLTEVPTTADSIATLHAYWDEYLAEPTITGHIIVIDVLDLTQNEILDFGEHAVRCCVDHSVNNVAFVTGNRNKEIERELSRENVVVRTTQTTWDAIDWMDR